MFVLSFSLSFSASMVNEVKEIEDNCKKTVKKISLMENYTNVANSEIEFIEDNIIKYDKYIKDNINFNDMDLDLGKQILINIDFLIQKYKKKSSLLKVTENLYRDLKFDCSEKYPFNDNLNQSNVIMLKINELKRLKTEYVGIFFKYKKDMIKDRNHNFSYKGE